MSADEYLLEHAAVDAVDDPDAAPPDGDAPLAGSDIAAAVRSGTARASLNHRRPGRRAAAAPGREPSRPGPAPPSSGRGPPPAAQAETVNTLGSTGTRSPPLSSERSTASQDLDHLEPELARGARPVARRIADAEVLELEEQRLDDVDPGRDDVAGAVAEPELAERLGIAQASTPESKTRTGSLLVSS